MRKWILGESKRRLHGSGGNFKHLNHLEHFINRQSVSSDQSGVGWDISGSIMSVQYIRSDPDWATKGAGLSWTDPVIVGRDGVKIKTCHFLIGCTCGKGSLVFVESSRAFSLSWYPKKDRSTFTNDDITVTKNPPGKHVLCVQGMVLPQELFVDYA